MELTYKEGIEQAAAFVQTTGREAKGASDGGRRRSPRTRIRVCGEQADGGDSCVRVGEK